MPSLIIKVPNSDILDKVIDRIQAELQSLTDDNLEVDMDYDETQYGKTVKITELTKP